MRLQIGTSPPASATAPSTLEPPPASGTVAASVLTAPSSPPPSSLEGPPLVPLDEQPTISPAAPVNAATARANVRCIWFDLPVVTSSSRTPLYLDGKYSRGKRQGAAVRSCGSRPPASRYFGDCDAVGYMWGFWRVAGGSTFRRTGPPQRAGCQRRDPAVTPWLNRRTYLVKPWRLDEPG